MIVPKHSFFAIFRAALFLCYIIYVWVTKIKIHKSNIFIFLFLCYLLILIPFSSNPFNTFRIYLQVSVSLLMFPVSYFIFNRLKDWKKLNNSMIWIMLIIVINTLIGSIFGFGRRYYTQDEDFLTGFLYGSRLYPGSIALILLPLILPLIQKRKYKLLVYILSFSVFIILVLSMRRTAFLIVLVGYFIYFIFSVKKKTLLFGILGFICIFYISLPIFNNILTTRFEARKERFQLNFYESEGRYIETILVFNDFKSFELIKKLFGTELFNSPGNFGEGVLGGRQIHSDILVLIHGSGVVGLVLYLLVHYRIFRTFIYYKKKLPNVAYIKEMIAVFISLFIIILVVSTIGGIHAITFRSIFFIYLGAILGIFRNIGNEKTITLN